MYYQNALSLGLGRIGEASGKGEEVGAAAGVSAVKQVEKEGVPPSTFVDKLKAVPVWVWVLTGVAVAGGGYLILRG